MKKESPKMIVIFSPEITKQIKLIEECNQHQVDHLNQWTKYIEGLVQYLSNRSIAFDYAGQNIHNDNGTITINNIYDVTYRIETDGTTPAYVQIVEADLHLEDYGLDAPTSESQYNINISQFIGIVEYITEQKYTQNNMKPLVSFINEGKSKKDIFTQFDNVLTAVKHLANAEEKKDIEIVLKDAMSKINKRMEHLFLKK